MPLCLMTYMYTVPKDVNFPWITGDYTKTQDSIVDLHPMFTPIRLGL